MVLPIGVKVAACALVAGMTACFAGCGGGGGSTSSPPPVSGPTPVPPPPPPPLPTVGTVEIGQTGLLLTAIGQTARLSTRVTDTNGNAMTEAVSWTASTGGSTTGANVEVGPDGLITAKSFGVAQVVAKVGTVESAPLLVAVSRVADGAILITDSLIVGEPELTNPTIPADADSHYDVTLTGMAAPEVGAVIINTESKPVGGRVLAVTPVGTDVKVSLEPLALNELLPEFTLNEVIDLSGGVMDFEPELVESYEIKRNGNSYRFTLKPTVQKAGDVRRKASKLHCTGDPGGIEPVLSLNQPPSFDLVLNPSVDAQWSWHGLERFVIRIDPVFTSTLKLDVSAELSVGLSCNWNFGVLRPPIAGVVSRFIGVQFPVGLKFEASAKAVSRAFTLETKLELRSSAKFGVNCPGGGECEPFADIGEFGVKYEPVVTYAPGPIRIEPTISASVFVRAQAGLLIVADATLDTFILQGGPKFTGSFGTTDDQIADAAYESNYNLDGFVTLRAEATLKKWVTRLFGDLTLEFGHDLIDREWSLSKSPFGTVHANKANLVAGEAVTFEINLESVHMVNALSAPYMVSRVVLIRREGSAGGVEVAGVTATKDQKRFLISYVPNRDGNASEYFVFVEPRFFPVDIALEVGRAAANTLEVFHVTSVCTPVTEWVEKTGFDGAQVRRFDDRICSGSVPGRNLRACRYNGVWMAKQENRDDLVYNTRNGFPGSYERDEFSVSADGTFEMRYEYGWSEIRETATRTITNFRESSFFVSGNPITRQAEGKFYRKIDLSHTSKVPSQTGTYNVTTLEAEVPFGNNLPAFGGPFTKSAVGPLPVLIESRGVVDRSEVPAECTGDSPYTQL